jgi:hypothetical protein
MAKSTEVWTVGPGGTVVIDPEPFAAAIVEKLGASVIPSSIPAEIGEWIRRTAEHNSYVWRFSIPMAGATCMCTDWTLNPDGTINLELQDTNGRRFWRGTFRPAEAVNA